MSFTELALLYTVGDGRQGHTDEAPYNAIHVGAAAPTLPQALVEQLAPGGRLIIPIGPEGANQNLEQVINLWRHFPSLLNIWICIIELHKQISGSFDH